MAKKKKGKNNPSHPDWMVARSLVLLLGPGPEGDEDRWDQAHDLLMNWSSTQSSVRGMLRELVNLKYATKVRCEDCAIAYTGDQGYADGELVCPNCRRDRAEYDTVIDVIANGP